MRTLRLHLSEYINTTATHSDEAMYWYKEAQTINISRLHGGHAPVPIDMPFGVLSGVPDVITHAKFCVNRLRAFSAAAPRKVPFPILFRTTRADIDNTTQSSI